MLRALSGEHHCGEMLHEEAGCNSGCGKPSGKIRGVAPLTFTQPQRFLLHLGWTSAPGKMLSLSDPRKVVWIWDLQVVRGVCLLLGWAGHLRINSKLAAQSFQAAASSGNLLSWCMPDRDPPASCIMGAAPLLQPCS